MTSTCEGAAVPEDSVAGGATTGPEEELPDPGVALGETGVVGSGGDPLLGPFGRLVGPEDFGTVQCARPRGAFREERVRLQ